MPAICYPMHKRRRRREAGEPPPTDIAYENRRAMGTWLADLRLAMDATQAEVTKDLQLGSAGALSAVELGRNSMPPDWGQRLADYYGVDRVEFGRKALYWLNPWFYALIFGMTPNLEEMLNAPPAGKKA